MGMARVVVTGWSPDWSAWFARIRDYLAPALAGLDVRLEHVGSTSVPGLAAKPVIDLDIVAPAGKPDLLPAVRGALAGLGYASRGDLGVPGRETFARPDRARHPQAPDLYYHLYLGLAGSASIANHLLLRDWLRAHPDDARRYGDLKRRLAAEFPEDIDAYIRGKTALVVSLLLAAGMPPSDVEAIRRLNTAL